MLLVCSFASQFRYPSFTRKIELHPTYEEYIEFWRIPDPRLLQPYGYNRYEWYFEEGDVLGEIRGNLMTTDAATHTSQGKAQRFVDWNAANNTHIAEDERMATLYANSMIHEIFTFGPLGYRTDQLGQTTQLTSPNLNNSELIMFTEQERTRALAALRP